MQIKMGFIGLGGRGLGMLERTLKKFPNVDVVAVCDCYKDRAENCQKLIKDLRNVDASVYTDYKELLTNKEVNAVLISASWEDHVPIAVESMKAGKITALEVGGAYCIDDCWQLVRTYEQTKTPFMFLENCCYSKYEVLAMALAKKGVFGEIVYCHGAYRHDLRKEIAYGVKNRHYRLRNYLIRNCDNYPTHELGPIAKILNINRGNRLLTLNSVASKARGLSEYVKQKDDLKDLHNKTFAQGDVVTTLITCADGTLISLKLDTTLPTTYSREFTIEGTKGKFCEDGYYVLEDGKFDHYTPLTELSANKYLDYLPKGWEELPEDRDGVTHESTDYYTLKAFFDAIINNEEMPIDVYDAAVWMSISCLSELSIKNNGAPVEIPDFTCGAWITREPKDVLNFDK
jgi:hypothetical protein